MNSEINGYALYRKSANISSALVINNVYLSNDKSLCTLIVDKPIDGVIYDADNDSYAIGKTRRVVMYTSSIINRLIDNDMLAPISTYLAKNRDVLATLLVGANVEIASLRIEANSSSYITPEGETAEWGKAHSTIIHAIDSITIDLANELNKAYYDVENVNAKATKVSEMKVGDITLVKVKNGKIEKYIVDYAKMQKELGVKSK
jgi:hypothetical protein